ncbi:metal-sulfur cluster assembly factor [Chryseobacterium sp. SNU WT5]|uniref:metal-sulfur cluster assembly factor n=1 Tax=Chryseobacterium sp. SNU WT5 TaxID=2594269 RepID=UPI00117DD806|nr:metal-sulfur cluster assembly factor [Chryseobacterium sp. SNU WT5]QDP85497.1 metal-sulfur cluster assembly factor [Chryseobacterium sp. SNU WT5]
MILDPTNENYDKIGRAELALYEVIDPELMVNIVDLGLVYDVDIKEGNKIKVTMTLTSPHCPMGDAIQTGVINVLEKEFPDHEIEIDLTFEPAWNYDMVSSEGMQQLNNR